MVQRHVQRHRMNFFRFCACWCSVLVGRVAGQKVAIIGAGIGGMACAAMLARSGKKVVVLEQHDRVGGATHTFEWSKKADETGAGAGDKRQYKCEFDAKFS